MRYTWGALLAWVVAGIPLVLSSLQALVVGVVGVDTAAGILAIPGFYGAAVAIERGGVAVTMLCLLGTVGWLGLGVSLFARTERRSGVALGGGTGLVVVLLFGWLAVSALTVGAVASFLTTVFVSAVALGGIGGALVLTSGDTAPDEATDSGPVTEHVDHTAGRKEGSEADIQRVNRTVDEGTLDRLEGIAPDAVRRARENVGQGSESVETELYRGIENALADGWFDMATASRYGERYEIVNLPSRLRELDLPTVGGRCHVGELERHVRDWIDDEGISIRDIAFAIETIDEHRSDIESHVREREEKFAHILEEIESDLESVRTVTAELEGTVGERTRMLAVENRHSEFDGVGTIEHEIAEAKSDLHACAFNEATQRLRDLRSESEALLTAVDFLRSLLGGIEHGQQSARIPNAIAKQLYVELDLLLEQQYGVTLSVEDERILIEDTEDDTCQPGGPESSPAGTPNHQGGSGRSAPGTVKPGELTDEILYTLRELKRERSGENVVEYQTENLPSSIADPGVLEALVRFCRRQSDIVDQVTLQENAPPGFLEIRFADGTTVADGIDELISRFLDRYSSDR